MPSSRNKKTVERYLDGFRRSDHAQILRCLTDDITWTVFGAFHLEWHTVAAVPGAPDHAGTTKCVIEGLPGGLLAEFPDWHVEPQEFTEAGDAILVRNLDTATGRESGVPIRQPFTQVWPFRGGRPVLVEKSGRGCRIGAVLFVVGVRPPTRGGANLKEPRS